MSLYEYEVRNEKVEKLLEEIGKMMRDVMPPGWGFALLIASFGEGGSMFYSSNVDRQNVIDMMREFIQKAEHN